MGVAVALHYVLMRPLSNMENISLFYRMIASEKWAGRVKSFNSNVTFKFDALVRSDHILSTCDVI